MSRKESREVKLHVVRKGEKGEWSVVESVECGEGRDAPLALEAGDVLVPVLSPGERRRILMASIPHVQTLDEARELAEKRRG
jgi:hypothetical protein